MRCGVESVSGQVQIAGDRKGYFDEWTGFGLGPRFWGASGVALSFSKSRFKSSLETFIASRRADLKRAIETSAGKSDFTSVDMVEFAL